MNANRSTNQAKIETLPKNGATLGGIHTDVSIIDEITKVEVDANNTDVKTEELIGIDVEVDKIVELTAILTDDLGAEGASSVAKEVTVILVDEVLDTSIVDTSSWEVASEDRAIDVIFVLTISLVEVVSLDVIVFCGV